jgi:hypothetical protein
VPGLGERASRLKRFAVKLRPLPKSDPYYLHTPLTEEERAPGWYMRDPDGARVYLGASAGDAEQYLRDQLREQSKPKRRKAAR